MDRIDPDMISLPCFCVTEGLSIDTFCLLQTSHLAQLRFIYPEAVSLSYAPNRRSSLGGKAEPILLIDISGPRSSTLAGAACKPADLSGAPSSSSIAEAADGNYQHAKSSPNAAARPGHTRNQMLAASRGQSARSSHQALPPDLMVPTQVTHPMPGTTTHSLSRGSPGSAIKAEAAAASTPGRALRQEFACRMAHWLSQQQCSVSAAAVVSHGSASAAEQPAAGVEADEQMSDAIPNANCTANCGSLVATGHDGSIDPGPQGLKRQADDMRKGPQQASAAGKLEESSHLRQSKDAEAGILPDVPEMEIPPVPTPRSMPMQTPFARAPLSAARGTDLASPALLPAARASAGLANARRLSFGGGEA